MPERSLNLVLCEDLGLLFMFSPFSIMGSAFQATEKKNIVGGEGEGLKKKWGRSK